MLFSFTLVKELELFDINAITAHGEQGWFLDRLDTYHTDCILVKKTFTAEFPSEYAVMRYFEALCELTFGEVYLLEAEAEAEGITILKNKDHCEWEMHRDGKIFRYDSNYHLFEEVKEVNNA